MAENEHGEKDPSDNEVADEALADEWAAALEEQQEEAPATAEQKAGGEDSEDLTGEAGDDSRQDEWAEAMAEAEAVQQEEPKQAPADDVRSAAFENFAEPQTGSAGSPDLDVILDIPVTISMEVGNTQIAIRNLLQLNQGSVIELDRLAGEPLDVLVNGTLIAHGEVVMVNEKFGIRLTDVISPSERVKKLNG